MYEEFGRVPATLFCLFRDVPVTLEFLVNNQKARHKNIGPRGAWVRQRLAADRGPQAGKGIVQRTV